MPRTALTVLASVLAGSAATLLAMHAGAEPPKGDQPVRLGNFSISLAVKDLAASREFYEKLGFRVLGKPGKAMAILQNDTATIGLFQEAFPKNTLTFNPGWDRTCATLAEFDDVRDLHKKVKDKGLDATLAGDGAGDGPAYFMLTDPDGNPVLIDQHVPKPKK